MLTYLENVDKVIYIIVTIQVATWTPFSRWEKIPAAFTPLYKAALVTVTTAALVHSHTTAAWT